MKFKESEISDEQTDIAAQALELSLWYLGLEALEPSLQFFEPDPEFAGEDITDIRWRGRMEAPNNLTGVCLEAPWKECPEVWVRSDLSNEELAVCIGHEMYHFAEYVKAIDDPDKERNAEQFGRFILNQMIANQPPPIMHAVKHV